MSDVIRLGGGSDDLMKRGLGGDSLSSVFAQDIELLSVRIAGTRFHQAIAEVDSLEVGQVLELKREVGNRHDEFAIAVRTSGEVMLGYIPRKENVVLARLMDAGKLLVGRIDGVKRSEANVKTGYDPGPEIVVMVVFRDF